MSHKSFNEYINSTIKDYLRLANIYESKSSKKKTNLVEMIIYGCITNKLNKNDIEDISIKETNKISNENDTKIIAWIW